MRQVYGLPIGGRFMSGYYGPGPFQMGLRCIAAAVCIVIGLVVSRDLLRSRQERDEQVFVRYSQSRMLSKSMDFPGNRAMDRGH
jgi:hypothetical protein